jgi:hypothetical protein
MTSYIHRVIFALPYSAANLETMQRLGIACCEELQQISGPIRLSIADGSMPIAQVLAYDTPGLSVQSKSFQSVYQAGNSGTADFYLGGTSFTDSWWSRLQARLTFLPAQRKYARWTLNYDVEPDPDKQVFLLRATNVAALNPYLQTAITEQEALVAAGLKPFRGNGSL